MAMMHTDTAVDLVMQSDFPIPLIAVTRKLHSIHAQIRSTETGSKYVFAINLRQGNERSPVVRPALHRRQILDIDFVLENGSAAGRTRTHLPGNQWRSPIFQRLLQRLFRINLQRDRSSDVFDRIAKDEPGPLHRTEQIGDHGKPTVSDVFKQNRRATRLKHPALNLRRLQMGIDRIGQPDQLLRFFQIVDTCRQTAIAHICSFLPRS